MDKYARIFVTDHRDMVGSAIVRRLQAGGYGNLLLRSRAEMGSGPKATPPELVLEMTTVYYSSARVKGLPKNSAYQAYDYRK